MRYLKAKPQVRREHAIPERPLLHACCGEDGAFGTVSLDSDPAMRPSVRGDVRALPFKDDAFAATHRGGRMDPRHQPGPHLRQIPQEGARMTEAPKTDAYMVTCPCCGGEVALSCRKVVSFHSDGTLKEHSHGVLA